MRALRFLVCFAVFGVAGTQEVWAQAPTGAITSPASGSTFYRDSFNMTKLTCTVSVQGQFLDCPDMVIIKARIGGPTGYFNAYGSAPVTYGYLSYTGSATVDIYLTGVSGPYELVLDMFEGGVLKKENASVVPIIVEDRW